MFEDRRREKRKNVFDSKATQPEKDEISNISERENNARKESIYLNKKIDDVNTRVNYFEKKPKDKLAQLISNDFHLLALIAFYYNYSDNVKLYYYSKAIEYGLEEISFENVANTTAKQKLIWIATRYDDIVFTCKDTYERKRAKKLARAFRKLSHEY